MVIQNCDAEGESYLIALDKKSGKTVWKTDRTTKWDDIEPNGKIRGGGDFRKAYTTPTLTKAGDRTSGPQASPESHNP